MTVTIDGKVISYFTAGSINLKLDSIASTFEFASHWEAQNKDHQEVFKPLQYKEVKVYNTAERLIFTGTILNHRFKSDKGRNLVIISGYSKCGILEDVTIPPKFYPLESTNSSLEDIAKKYCKIFGIKVLISDQAKSIDAVTTGEKNKKLKEKKIFFSAKSTYESLKAKSKSIFGRTSAEPTQTIKDYLAKLAGQKNIILSHNQYGDVIMFQPDYDQKPRYSFTKGNSLSMSADFNGQELHSEINIVRQPSDDNEGVSTVDRTVNTLVNKYRPTTKILSSGEDTQTKEAAKNELANELRSIEITVEVQGLLDEIYPGEIVNVHNHWIYSYAYNRFMVNSIVLKFDEKSDTTILNLLVPEAFTGGELIRNILYNHLTDDHHQEPTLNYLNNDYINNTDLGA
jgi:prophage tail gpP-like protein